MKSPVQGRPLCVYTAFSDTAVGALLAQEDDEGIEHPIYYFIRILRDAELRYPKEEKACLALIHSIQKFRHYLLSNKVILISKSDPAKFLLLKLVLMGRSAKWLLQMSACASPRAINGQAIAYLLAVFPGEGTTALREDLPGEFQDISVVEEEAWLLYFDGSATPSNNAGGEGVVLVSPTDEVFSHSFKLYFQCTNYSAEYEAFLIGLLLAKQAGATRLEIRGDSKLLANQMNGVNNRHADCLATLASKLQFEGLEETLTVKSRTVESTWLSQCKDIGTCDWRTRIIQELSSSLSQGKLNRVHDEIYGQTLVVTLYRRRLQFLGYYWPEMETQSRLLQKSCSNCQAPPHQLEVFSISHVGDWREPYISYLRDGVIPANQKEVVKMKQMVKRWGLDIIGNINPPSSKQHEYVITATEYFTKWVEAIPLRGTTGETIVAFIKEYIICRFGVSKHIITDNGTPFANKPVRELLEEYGIKQVFSTIYYPQENGQAESTNKTLIRILSRTIHDNPKEWHEQFQWRYGHIGRHLEAPLGFLHVHLFTVQMRSS
ncbi:uncharacterized protein LOC113316187 [Papaver somniferum]|uniref:uncharacterized protein LOC113316187 n=1 Tax=Papaver somniferum TaxID=3469 RepID=UPI000E6F6A3B|nr:uncharacterized protein LOC113316187 [Papaver somniferum]